MNLGGQAFIITLNFLGKDTHVMSTISGDNSDTKPSDVNVSSIVSHQ